MRGPVVSQRRLAGAWEAAGENETLLFTFSWKIILADAAFTGFSCVVGL